MQAATRFLGLVVCGVALLGAVRPGAHSQQSVPRITDEADALYARREDPASARRAADILAAALKGAPSDFEAAWRLARIQYWRGNHAPEREQKQCFEAGAAAARSAVAARPNRPEGHFWLGMDLGGLAERGMMAGLRYHDAVREEFETAARLDPGFEKGSAYTALGGWYLRVPGFLGGDSAKAEQLLRRALTYDADSTVTRYFLAQALLASGRNVEARAELQKVIDAPLSDDSAPEDREWKQRARALVATLRARTGG